MKTKKFYTISAAAKKLGISRQALHKAIRRQLLDAERRTITETIIRKTKALVITEQALDRYKKECGVSLSHQERGKKT